MNPSDWIKAANLVMQQKQEAAIPDTDQLSSMPLSQLAMDESGSPVVHYGMHMPTATSMPMHTEIHTQGSQQEDSYQQIIPGIPQGPLYPTLSSLNSEEVTPQEAQTLHDKVSKGLEKYLQDAEQCQALEDNYFDNNSTCQRKESNLETAEQMIQPSKGIQIPLIQPFTADTNVAGNIPESLKADTGHNTPQECTAVHENQKQTVTSEDIEPVVNAQHCDRKHTVEDTTEETTTVQSQLLAISPTSQDKICMPTEKVGCILVTSHLKQFPKDYPLSSEKQAFLDICNMLSLLDKYLYNNPKHHTHCMSSHSEYVILLRYAICFNIDLTTFPTLWVVLSILLETQDVTHEHVKCLQEEYDTYYADKPKDYMLKLERQLVELQNCMYDSVTHNFDRVSSLHDNGLTPLLRQEGDQSDEDTTPENAIDDDAIDIRTLYPLWSSDINDMNDTNQMTNYKSMKNIRDEIGKDMPLKTDINKPYIDNIDAYDRDRHLITVSLSDRLDLGQNSLPGAQQLRAIVKHTDQISEFPEHLS